MGIISGLVNEISGFGLRQLGGVFERSRQKGQAERTAVDINRILEEQGGHPVGSNLVTPDMLLSNSGPNVIHELMLSTPNILNADAQAQIDSSVRDSLSAATIATSGKGGLEFNEFRDVITEVGGPDLNERTDRISQRKQDIEFPIITKRTDERIRAKLVPAATSGGGDEGGLVGSFPKDERNLVEKRLMRAGFKVKNPDYTSPAGKEPEFVISQEGIEVQVGIEQERRESKKVNIEAIAQKHINKRFAGKEKALRNRFQEESKTRKLKMRTREEMETLIAQAIEKGFTDTEIDDNIRSKTKLDGISWHPRDFGRGQ